MTSSWVLIMSCRCGHHRFRAQSPHRISTGGSLLFMKCVSLTLTGQVSAWQGSTIGDFGKALVRSCHCPLSEAMQLKAFESLWNVEKNACYFETNWISCILNWGVRCDVVSDARQCCCCQFLLLTFPPPNWRTSLTTTRAPRALVCEALLSARAYAQVW